MNNLDWYEKGRAVPTEAMKTIQAGRLKGMTDINPMWRIKKLTEMFGPVGKGWKLEIVKKEIVSSPDTKEMAAFVDVNLYVKYDGIDGSWSLPIPGTGGAVFVAAESKGPRMNDECYKMAYTDAISVAAKSIGIGADVYYGKDKTKYTADTEPKAKEINEIEELRHQLRDRVKKIMSCTGRDMTAESEKLCDKCGIGKPKTADDYNKLILAAEVTLGELYDSKD